VRLLRALIVVAGVIAVGALAAIIAPILSERAQTARTSARFDPPVWAGQNVPVPCATGGFYARDGESIVITIAAHCAIATEGAMWRDTDGRLVGVFGRAAQMPDCVPERFCSPADVVALTLAPDRIPWGHLNMVDMGAGGYRTFASDTQALSCGDIHVGAVVEIDGRERYRTGKVVAVGPYAYENDTIFPCMAVADIRVGVGDSGGAVLVDGMPGGVISRELGTGVGFTSLAEGLENLGLTLCTTPSCDLSPEQAEQPTH